MKDIKTVINKNGILYKYILNKYSFNEDCQIILPKLITGEQFYSAGFAERIADVDWNSLPLLELDTSEIALS